MKSFAEVTADRYARQFDTFIDKYMTSADRRVIAEQLLPGVPRPPLSQQSHAVLAAHWGDDNEALRRTAYAFYEQKDKITRGVGSLAAVFMQGKPGDIDPRAERLPGPIKLQLGVIQEGSLLFSFPETAAQASGRAAQAYRLRFAAGIPVTGVQTLEISPAGNTVVRQSPPEAEQVLISYRGDVSVEPDQQLYDATRRITARPLVFGAVSAHILLRNLAEFVGGTAWDNFQALHNQKMLHPGAPLPPLGAVFSYVPVAAAANA